MNKTNKENFIFLLFGFLFLFIFINTVFANDTILNYEIKSTPSPLPSNSNDIIDEKMLPEYWKWWDVYPTLSTYSVDVYNDAILNGRNPHAFSIIGDCQSEPNIFMGRFDTGDYKIPESEEHLAETIEFYQGMFNRDNVTVKDGLSVSSVFVPLWNEPDVCESNESPLDCEVRINNPSIMIISLGTNWKPGHQEAFEENLRNIIDYCLENHILPVLATKADNVEGDESINRIIANLAYEYDIPMWNFWFTVQGLPNHGIDETRGENEHLYLIPNAWDVKSFSGIRLLDSIYIQLDLQKYSITD